MSYLPGDEIVDVLNRFIGHSTRRALHVGAAFGVVVTVLLFVTGWALWG